MKMRTYHLEAILQFLENAVQDGDTKISIGEDQFIPVSILREAHDEIDNIDRKIEYLHMSNISLRDAMNDVVTMEYNMNEVLVEFKTITSPPCLDQKLGEPISISFCVNF